MNYTIELTSFGPRSIWIETDIDIYLDEFDGKLQVFWTEEVDFITIDTLQNQFEVDVSELREVNKSRLIESINEYVAEMRVEQFRELENEMYENHFGV